MIKNNFAKISDIIFVFIGSFAISFCLLRYYIDNYAMTFVISLIPSFIAAALTILLFSSKSKKQRKSKEENDLFTKLLFCGDEEISERLCKAIQKIYKAEIKNNLIISRNTAFYCHFSETLRVSSFAKIYAKAIKSQIKTLVILCAESDLQAKEYAKQPIDIKTIILDGNRCYDFLKWIKFEEPNINLNSEKHKFIKNFAGFLSPDKAPRYFSLFIFFLGFAFMIGLSVYYIVFASILLILSVLSKMDILGKIKK